MLRLILFLSLLLFTKGIHAQSPILVPSTEEIKIGLSNPDKLYPVPDTPAVMLADLAEQGFNLTGLLHRFFCRLLGKPVTAPTELLVTVNGKCVDHSSPPRKNMGSLVAAQDK